MSKIKLNAQTESIILSAIEEGASYAIAAGSAGIHKNTLINWIKKGQKERAVEPYKSFIKKLRVSESKAALLHLGVVKAAALDGQWKASLAMLERFRTLEDSHDIECYWRPDYQRFRRQCLQQKRVRVGRRMHLCLGRV